MSLFRKLSYISMTLVALVACFSGAFFFERKQVERNAQTYVSIWEDEIVKSLIEKQDTELLRKIASQLSLMSSPIETTQISLLSDSFRIQNSFSFRKFQIPLALNYMTVGMLEAKLNQKQIAIAALSSPLFLISIVLILASVALLWLREKKSEFAQNTLRQKLEHETAIAQMAKQVAHDIRGPLSALQVLARKEGVIANQYLELFQQGASRIRQVADDLLRSAKSQHQRPAPENASGKNNLSFQRIFRGLKSELSLRSPAIQWNFPQETIQEEPELAFEESKMIRLLSNLLQNSAEAKATTVNVQLDKKANDLLLSIQDNGVGIPQHLLPQILSGGISLNNGNGIGLSSAKSEIEKAGGELRLFSKINEGTLIQIRLPIQLNPIQR